MCGTLPYGPVRAGRRSKSRQQGQLCVQQWLQCREPRCKQALQEVLSQGSHQSTGGKCSNVLPSRSSSRCTRSSKDWLHCARLRAAPPSNHGHDRPPNDSGLLSATRAAAAAASVRDQRTPFPQTGKTAPVISGRFPARHLGACTPRQPGPPTAPAFPRQAARPQRAARVVRARCVQQQQWRCAGADALRGFPTAAQTLPLRSRRRQLDPAEPP